MNLKEIVEQLESCNFECNGGNISNNVAFIELKNMANEPTTQKHSPCFDCPSMKEYFPECQQNCGKSMPPRGNK